MPPSREPAAVSDKLRAFAEPVIAKPVTTTALSAWSKLGPCDCAAGASEFGIGELILCIIVRFSRVS